MLLGPCAQITTPRHAVQPSSRPRAAFRATRQRSVARGSEAAMSGKQELFATPGVCAQPDAETKDYIFQQTMIRVRDPKAALDFYTRVLGMTLIAKLDFPDMAFTLYFVAYADPGEVPEDPKERAKWMFSRPACLELTHNYGTESDPAFSGYCNGNVDPGRGFGHIGLAVPDVEKACERFEKLGVEFVKRPNDGKMKGLAFIKDPDGYWIEILNPAASSGFGN